MDTKDKTRDYLATRPEADLEVKVEVEAEAEAWLWIWIWIWIWMWLGMWLGMWLWMRPREPSRERVRLTRCQARQNLARTTLSHWTTMRLKSLEISAASSTIPRAGCPSARTIGLIGPTH